MPAWLIPLIPFLLKEVPEVIDAINRWRTFGDTVPPADQLNDLIAQVAVRRAARARLDGTTVVPLAPPPAVVSAILAAVVAPAHAGGVTLPSGLRYYPPVHR